MIRFRQWTPEEYRKVVKSHYWNLAMSIYRLNPWRFFLKNYEKSILSAVSGVLSADELAALVYQMGRIDGINRYSKGRFHQFFVDRRRFPPLSEAKGEVPLATLKIRQGGRRIWVIVEISDGALYSISFHPGQFKEKEPFEILEVMRGGKPSKTAQALDRWAHGRDPEAEPMVDTGQTEKTLSTGLSSTESKTIFLLNDASSFGNERIPQDVSVFRTIEDAESYCEPWFSEEPYLLIDTAGRRYSLVPDGFGCRATLKADGHDYRSEAVVFLKYFKKNCIR